MISEQEALKRVLAELSPTLVTDVVLAEAQGRYAGRDVRATVALPGFDNSMMDGYAVRASDTARLNQPLRIKSEQPAGLELHLEVDAGTAVRIFTGAPMPTGADAVIMQEDVDRQEGFILCREPVVVGENVRLAGADLCVGQVVLKRGQRLTPGRLSVLASQGLEAVPVHELPRIAVVTTGNELVPPGQPLRAGQIYNSNGLMLQALVKEAGAATAIHVHCADDLEATVEALSGLVATHDVIIISGGVSVGDHDHIKPALQRLEIEPDLWRVKVKPGKPFLFARSRGERECSIFGLPGNPVSSFVTYHLFVKPALLKMMGAAETCATVLPLPVAGEVANEGDRLHYLRGVIENGHFRPQGLQQSHALFALSQANALLRLEPGQRLQPGEIGSVMQL